MITIKEIARLAGVSPKTAERALSGVTKDMRSDARERAERVRLIAQKYAYSPSAVSRTLRSGSSHCIGFLVDILTDQFLAAAVETAMDEASESQYRISLKIAKYDPAQTEAELRDLLSSRVEGVITSCTFAQLPPVLFNSMIKRKFPFFSLCGKTPCSRVGSISFDYSNALPQAVRLLAEKGHKKITLCLFRGKEESNKANGRIFLEACRKEGVEPDLRIHQDKQQAALLAEEKIPALILYGKYSMRIYQDRCMESGFSADVIGIYNEWTCAGAKNFPLCGVILEPAEESVRIAVRQIIAQIRGEKEPCHHILKARFIPHSKLASLKVLDLANQILFQES